nr:hypothetical protein [Streptomyces sp. NRRL B-24720]
MGADFAALGVYGLKQITDTAAPHGRRRHRCIPLGNPATCFKWVVSVSQRIDHMTGVGDEDSASAVAVAFEASQFWPIDLERRATEQVAGGTMQQQSPASTGLMR